MEEHIIRVLLGLMPGLASAETPPIKFLSIVHGMVRERSKLDQEKSRQLSGSFGTASTRV